MTLTDYLNQLIQDGTWSKLSSPAHSLFLYILAKSQGQPVRLSYSQISKATGISKGAIKGKLQELLNHNLILANQADSTYKPVADLDYSCSPLPMPPSVDPEDGDTTVPGGENTGGGLWDDIQDYLTDNLEGILAGALIAYFIKLWLEYIERQQQNDPFADWPGFVQKGELDKYGLQQLEDIAKRRFNKPLGQVTPKEWQQIFMD